MATVIARGALPFAGSSHAFVGADHGGVGVSLFLVDADPGKGPTLHAHPYDEVILVEDGIAAFTIDDEAVEVQAGHLVVVPAGQVHGFVNDGPGQLRVTAIHVNARFETEWLEPPTGREARGEATSR